mgnify:CR=1 FL=1
MMGALRKLIPRDVLQMKDVPAALGADSWAGATARQRAVAELRAEIVRPLAELVDQGASITSAARMLVARAAAGALDPSSAHALQQLGADGKSVPTLKRWISAYRREGRAGLIPRHTGRVRGDYGWELRAIALYNIPGKPGFADVAFNLRKEGFESATESRVKRYLKALPATLGDKSPYRIGPHLHRLTRRKFQKRSVDDLFVGEIYAGDGHTIDCYLADPKTGNPYRPELVCYIDIRSRYIAGWYFSEAESGTSTLMALSAAMLNHDHVPAWLYIDRGAGYRAKMLSDESVGWYQKFSIETINALPGNPHGKGWIERFFRTVRDKHDKFFYGGQVYCGDDMAEEVNRRLSDQLKAGKRRLPTVGEYLDSFRKFIDAYHGEPMDVMNGQAPNDLWPQLARVPVVTPAEAVMRPSKTPTVSRQMVVMDKRFYYHEALALYDGQKVEAEYDLNDDIYVTVRDLKGRFIAVAELAYTMGVLPHSRREEGLDRRLKGQEKRLERKLEEVRARRHGPITADEQLRGIAQLQEDAEAAAPASDPPALPDAAWIPALRPVSAAPSVADYEPEPKIDITTWKDPDS